MASNKRDKQLKFRVTADEKRIIEKAADLENRSLNVFLRICAVEAAKRRVLLVSEKATSQGQIITPEPQTRERSSIVRTVGPKGVTPKKRGLTPYQRVKQGSLKRKRVT